MGQREDKSHRYNQQCEKNEMVMGRAYQSPQKTTDGPRVSQLGYQMTRKDDKGDQPSCGETTGTNTGATRSGRGQPNTGLLIGDGMVRPSPIHGTLRLPNDEMMTNSVNRNNQEENDLYPVTK